MFTLNRHATTDNVKTNEARENGADMLGRRRTPLRRFAKLAGVPLAAIGLVLGLGASPAAAATPGNIGQLGVTVGCFGQTHQLSITPWAIEGSNWNWQYVAFQLAYTSSNSTYYTGWYGPKVVDGTQLHDSYFTGPYTTSSPVSLGAVTASNVHGVNQVWVRAGFWNGSAYEYTSFVGASTYNRFINGQSLGGSPAPCVMS